MRTTSRSSMRCTGLCAGKGMTTILAVIKFMWYSIVKEFNWKVSSTWSDDDRAKDAAFAHQKHGDEGQVKVLQLDFIVGSKERHDERKLWDTWDHFPIYARIEEGRDAKHFSGKRKRNGVDRHPQRTGGMQRSQLTWCCMPGPK